MSARGWSAESGSKTSMSRPAATSPTAAVNPKFGQKLDFIERDDALVGRACASRPSSSATSTSRRWNATCGATRRCSTSSATRRSRSRRWAGLQQAHGWIDIGRKFVPAPERCFTWWSYRSPDWTRNDRGRRLDHMWASPALAAHSPATACSSRAAAGSGRRDHVPLILRDRALSATGRSARRSPRLRAGRPVRIDAASGRCDPGGRDRDRRAARAARSRSRGAAADQRRAGRGARRSPTERDAADPARPVADRALRLARRGDGAGAGRSRPAISTARRSGRSQPIAARRSKRPARAALTLARLGRPAAGTVAGRRGAVAAVDDRGDEIAPASTPDVTLVARARLPLDGLAATPRSSPSAAPTTGRTMSRCWSARSAASRRWSGCTANA